MSKVALLIQARMSSTRFPGKVLEEVNPREGYFMPMLQYQIERLSRLKKSLMVGVVTSAASADDKIAKLCENIGTYCYRGSGFDLLSRYYCAAEEINAETIVRVTSDCPLIDPKIVEDLLQIYLNNEHDFVSNTEPLPTTYPDGMDVSIFSFKSLKKSYEEALKPSEREHVTFYITNNPKKFKLYKLDLKNDLSKYRLTVDYKRDLLLIRKIFDVFKEKKIYQPGLSYIINVIDNNSLFKVNEGHRFGEGWISSFERDKEKNNFEGKLSKPLELKKTNYAWKKQIKYIPGGAQTFSKMPNAYCEGSSPKLLYRGKGGHVWDLDDNEYCDFVLGLGPIILGHCYKEVDKAYSECAANFFSTPSLGHPLEAKLGEKLSEIIPSAEMVRYGKNGSDATAGAVRLARGITGKEIIGCSGYHGWQDWFMGQTNRNRGIPKAIGELTKSFKYNDLNSIENIFENNKGNVAAIIMEPMCAEFPEDDFLKKVKSLCEINSALLIFDEVCTGFRMDIGGAQTLLGVTPDISCFGKAVSNGYPISIIAGKKKYLKEFEDIFFSFTFGGELPAIAAALKTIEILIEKDVCKEIIQKGNLFLKNFNLIAEQLGIDYMRAIGHGSWPKYEISDYKNFSSEQILTLFQQELIKRNILTRSSPFICYQHSNSDIELFLNAAKKAMIVVDNSISKGNLMDNIVGKQIRTIIRDENIKH